MAKLKPKEKAFYAHFKTAATALAAGAEVLADLVKKSADRGADADKLAGIAKQADQAYMAILDALRDSFVTPFDRSEIQDLGRSLAAATRRMETAAALIHLLDPPTLPAEVKTVVALLGEAAAATAAAMDRLRKLKGLHGHRVEIVGHAADAEFARRLLLARLTGGEIDPLDALELSVIAQELDAAMAQIVTSADVVATILITEG